MTILDFIGRNLNRRINDFLKDTKRGLFHKLDEEINKIKRKVILYFTIILIMFTSFIFFTLAFVSLLQEYFLLAKTISFFIAGIVLLIAVIFLKLIK